MNKDRFARVWRWLPRALGSLYALFLSLFAFDSWEGVSSFWQGLARFLVHLAPVYGVVIAVAIGWRRPKLAGWLLLALAAVFSVVFGWRELELLLILAGPPVLTGALFLLDGSRHPSPGQLRPG